MKTKVGRAILLPVCLSACVNPPIVQEGSIDDYDLSCLAIRDQSNKLKQMKVQVENDKGVSGTNAAMFIAFWPGIFFNEMNSNEALEAISKRQARLMTIYSEKGCYGE